MPTCGKCGVDHARVGQRHCCACHAAYMRAWRKTHPMTVEQRAKHSARSIAKAYLRRGKIERQPCVGCGDANAEMHHPDYARPRLVEWYCRPCHLAVHREAERAQMLLMGKEAA